MGCQECDGLGLDGALGWLAVVVDVVWAVHQHARDLHLQRQGIGYSYITK